MKEPTILYEDDDIVAVNKPAGLVVHGDGKTTEPILVDWILKNYPEVKDIGESWVKKSGETILRPGIIHRLDRETSGVMLVAKTKESFQNLKRQFQNHEIKKIYHTFVFGEMLARLDGVSGGKTMEGTINRPIGRSAKDFRMWSAQRGARGELREAITDYKVIKNFGDYAFVEISPKTGRTHQIRVHFKAISHPLVADSLYAPARENTLGFKHLALHSYQITFTDLHDKTHTVTAPYPEDFVKALQIFKI